MFLKRSYPGKTKIKNNKSKKKIRRVEMLQKEISEVYGFK
jgi:hypothetical protein